MSHETVSDKLTDLEARSMRDNLIFYGLPEINQDENCENIVKDRICVLSVCCSICLSEHYNACYETDDGCENSR